MECKLDSWFESNKEYGPVPLRILLGSILIMSAYAKIFVFSPSGFASMLSGFPMPIVFAWLAILAEGLGGIALLIGFKTRYAAIPVIITMIVAASMHLFVFEGANAGFKGAQPALLVLAGTITLLFIGSGKLSVDKALEK